MCRLPKPLAVCLALLCLVAIAAPGSARAQFVVLDLPAFQSRYVELLPGQTATLAFTIRNGTTITVEGTVGGALEVEPPVFDTYRFSANEPALCGPPMLERPSGFTAVRFPIAPLAPGASRTCAYTVQRAAGGASDLGFHICWRGPGGSSDTNYCYRRVRLGTLPDVELALETQGLGTTAGTVLRLQLINRSAVDVESRLASTACHEFAGGPADPTAFDVDGNLPGGCAAVQRFACIDFTGTRFDTRAFLLGPAPAGGSSTCLLRVRQLRPNGRQQVPLFLHDDLLALPAGAVGFDPIRARETVSIGLGLLAPVAVPVGQTALLLTMLALLIAGLLVLRRGSA